jgi:DHA2 family multidrug resistance protein
MNTTATSLPEERQLSTGDWLGFFSMAVGVFMAVLDIQIVASSITQIQAGLSASQDEIAWVQTSYLIAEVIIIPLSGWLGRVFSTRYLYVISVGGFTLASLACAFAWNLPSMIVFRCLQGFLGGAMIPMTFTVIFILFPPRLQAGMGIVLGLIVTIAPTVGPVLGGYLTDAYNWQVLFLINIIPGILVSIAVWTFVDIDKPEWGLLKKIDFIGIGLITIFLGCLQYVLEEGAKKQWFEDHLIVSLTIVAVISGIAMLIWELKNPHPIIDLHAFRNFNFAVGCWYSFVLGIGLYTIIYLTPLFLAGVKGLNSLHWRIFNGRRLVSIAIRLYCRTDGKENGFALDVVDWIYVVCIRFVDEFAINRRIGVLGIFCAASDSWHGVNAVFCAD